MAGSKSGSVPLYLIRPKELGSKINTEYIIDVASKLAPNCIAKVDNTTVTVPSTQLAQAAPPVIFQLVKGVPFTSAVNWWNSVPSVVQSGHVQKQAAANPHKVNIQFLGNNINPTVAGDNGPIKCDECSATFETQKELNRHKQLHLIRKCGICKVNFQTPVELQEHLATHLAKPIQQMPPETRKELNGHKQLPIFHKCSVCKVHFQSSRELQKHFATHLAKPIQQVPLERLPTLRLPNPNPQPEKMFFPPFYPKCSKCPAKFKSRKELNLHLREHRVRKCGMCNLPYATEAELKEHLKTHVSSLRQSMKMSLANGCGNEPKQAEEKSLNFQITSAEALPLKCTKCPGRFKSRKQLLAHWKIHRIRKCGMCQSYFEGPAELKEHLMLHTKNLIKANQGILNGVQAESVKPPEGECCDLTPPIDELPVTNSVKFTSQKELIAFMKLISKESCICGVCDNRFRTPDELMEHLKIHTESPSQSDQQPVDNTKGDPSPAEEDCSNDAVVLINELPVEIPAEDGRSNESSISNHKLPVEIPAEKERSNVASIAIDKLPVKIPAEEGCSNEALISIDQLPVEILAEEGRSNKASISIDKLPIKVPAEKERSNVASISINKLSVEKPADEGRSNEASISVNELPIEILAGKECSNILSIPIDELPIEILGEEDCSNGTLISIDELSVKLLAEEECSNVLSIPIDELPIEILAEEDCSNEALISIDKLPVKILAEEEYCNVALISNDKLPVEILAEEELFNVASVSKNGSSVETPIAKEHSYLASMLIDRFPIKCSECPARFRSNQLLTAHMKFHKRYECGVCFAQFATTPKLDDHIQIHMKSLFEANLQLVKYCLNEPLPATEASKFIHDKIRFNDPLTLFGLFTTGCDICGARFRSEQALNAHLRYHESCKCDVCEIQFETPDELQEHSIIHVETLCQSNEELLIPDHTKPISGYKKHKGTVAHIPNKKPRRVCSYLTAEVVSDYRFECSKCHARFDSQMSLDSHLELHKIQCSICSVEFDTETELNEHLKTHSDKQCMDLDEGDIEIEIESGIESESESEFTLTEESSDSESVPDSQPFKCDKCSSTYGTYHGLNAHMQIHQEHGTCGVCGVRFKTSAGLLEHLKIHLQSLPGPRKELISARESMPIRVEEKDRSEAPTFANVCSQCSATFSSQRSLNAHLILHSSRECNECCIRFDSVVARHEHMQTYHNASNKCSKLISTHSEERSLNTALVSSSKSTNDSFECDICSFKLKSQLSLNAHKRVHTSRECGICWERFESSPELHKHLRKHTKGWPIMAELLLHPCPYCEFVFTTGRRLFFHLKEHSERATFDCSKCHLSFYTKEEYAEHRMSHGLISCNLCDAKFRIQSELDEHNQLHYREKPFACTQCIKRYFSKNELVRHMRTHSKDKPFACSFCPARFRQPTAVKEHEMLHRTEKKLGCAHCSARFNRKTTLKHHLKVHAYLEFSKEKMVEEIKAKPHHCPTCFARFCSITSLRRHLRNKSCDKPQSMRNRRPMPVELVEQVEEAVEVKQENKQDEEVEQMEHLAC